MALNAQWEHQLRQVIDNSSAVIYVKDLEGRYQLVNRAFLTLFELTAEAVLGCRDDDLFAPDVARRLGVNDRHVAKSAQPAEFEETLIFADVPHTYLSTKFPLFDGDGGVCGVCGISTDISSRKQVEEVLRSVALGVSAATGGEVFGAITRHLVTTLEVDMAFVSRLVGGESADCAEPVLETLALQWRDRNLDNVVYTLPGTPCERVFDQSFHVVADGLADLYPGDQMALDFDLVSYGGYPLFSTTGEPLGLIAVAHSRPLHDRELIESTLKIFSVRAAAELQRLDAEASYRAIFDACEDAIFVHDLHSGAILDVNTKACDIYGYSHSEMLAADINLFSAGYAPYTALEAARWLAAARDEGPQRFEWHRRNRDGSLYWDEVVLRRAVIGGVERILAFTRDITQRKLAEDALRNSEQLYRAIVSTALDCIITMDGEGLVVGFNPAAEQCFGFSQGQVMGKPLADLIIPPRFRSAHRQGMIHYLGTGRGPFLGRRVEVVAQRASGEEFPAELAINALERDGKPLFIGYLRDITERHQAESERNQLEQQLRQAQRMEAIGQLSGGIAHDFNNLLTSILGYATMGVERAGRLGDDKMSKYFTQVRSAGDRARELVAQLLTFSRGSRGQPRVVDLQTQLRDFVPLLQSLLPASIEFDVQLDDNLPLAMLDPLQLEQVLMNLCINARDAMDGRGALQVGLTRNTVSRSLCASCQQLFSGPHLVLRVADNGPGIKPGVATRMFEPFYSTKAAGRGSGMGLAMVHGIVHECGGHIRVASAPSGGAIFEVMLPFLSQPVASEGNLETNGEAGLQLLRGRVAVVDDEPLVADFMAEQLREWGLDVETFGDPLAACERLLETLTEWDLVIVDQTMPRLTGMELATALLQTRSDLPVLLYTGYSEQLGEDAVLASGVRQLLRKPIDSPQLYAALAACLVRA